MNKVYINTKDFNKMEETRECHICTDTNIAMIRNNDNEFCGECLTCESQMIELEKSKELELLRKVLNENNYEYNENEDYIRFVMTNHGVIIDKDDLSVMDDFNGTLYKDIDDVIDSIINK